MKPRTEINYFVYYNRSIKNQHFINVNIEEKFNIVSTQNNLFASFTEINGIVDITGGHNIAPTDIIISMEVVQESSASGTSVAIATVVDADSSTYEYSLSRDAGGRFSIDPYTGEISVNDGAILDYETSPNHTITVRAKDTSFGKHKILKSFTIAVGDVDETPVNAAPYYLTLWGSTVDENSPGGAAVGRLIGKDPDAGDILTYSLIDDAGGRFRVDAASGALTVAAGANLDFETQASHTIIGRVTDPGGLSYNKTLTIAVADKPEGGSSLSAPDYVFDALTHEDDARWNAGSALGAPVTVTYTFLTEIPDYYDPDTTEARTFQPFTVQQVDAARSLLSAIESFTNVDFVETGIGDAQITLGNADLGGSLGWAYGPRLPGIEKQHGDVWINHSFGGLINETLDLTAATPGSEGWKTLAHEIGHALGLSHPTDLPLEETSRKWTVMSYTPHLPMDEEPIGYQPYDISVLQDLYGADTSTAAGDDTYDLAGLGNVIKTFWDGGGQDTFDASGETASVVLDLRAGGFSSIGAGVDNIAIAYDAVIENAVGGRGDDVLIGNTADNRLTGGDGADRFVFHDACGSDTITDFEDGRDLLDLSLTDVAFSALAISASGSGAVIAWNGGSVDLNGINAAQIGSDDFLFPLA